MTGNHLLLYRLAELMLDFEQHILPVDLLFDDEKIGDFVKSIQIDSPYQQMLLDGVLTESVREEKLYVSFTVEGYFHFVLGEVIYSRAEGLGAEALKYIVEENNLNGAKEGVEQCLIRDVQKDDLSRLVWMIDNSNRSLDCAIHPLSHAFLFSHFEHDYNADKKKDHSQHCDHILQKLLENQTERDVEALVKSIKILQLNKKYTALKSIYLGINKFLIPNTIEKALLLTESIEYIPNELRREKLQSLLLLALDFKKERKSMLLFLILGEKFYFNSEYDYAQKCFELLLKVGHKLLHSDDQLFISCYNDLALVYTKRKNYKAAISYQKKSLRLSLKKYGKNHRFTALYFRNIGACYSHIENWKKSVENLQISQEIESVLSGEYDENYGHTLVNLSLVFKSMGQMKEAIYNAEKALTIYSAIYGEDHIFVGTVLNNLGTIFLKNNELSKSLFFIEKSHNITLKHNGGMSNNSAVSFNNLACLQLELGKFDEALFNFKRAKKIKSKIFGESDLSIAEVNMYLGAIYAKKDDLLNAIKSLKSASRIYKIHEIHFQQAKCHDYLGDYYLALKDSDRAFKNFKKAWRFCIEVLGKNHSRTISIQDKISNIILNDL
jgi:tetratricopeptide (TPR) repeat protein